IVTPAWDAERARALSRADKTVGTDDLAAELATVLTAHKLDGRKAVAVGLATMAQGLAKRIEAALGGNPRTNELFIRQLARIRTPEELAASEQATAIAERGYEHMLASVRRGMREYELAAELYCAM